MKILNVVINKAGIIDNIESFVILDSTDPIVEDKVIKEAEQLFEKWCINNGWKSDNEEETMENLIDDGYWESSNYDSVSLVWSNVNL